MRRETRPDTSARPDVSPDADLQVAALDDGTVALGRRTPFGRQVVVARLCGAGRIDLGALAPPTESWEVVLTTEDEAYAEDGRRPETGRGPTGALTIAFSGPAAVVLRHGAQSLR